MLWQTHDLCITIPTTEQGIEKMNKKSTDIFYQNMESGNPYLKIFLPYQDNPSKETIN